MGKNYDYVTTAVIDGVPVGTFDTFSGGDAPRGNTKRRHGGQLNKTVHGGMPDHSNVTIGRNHDALRDQKLVRRLLGIGKGSHRPIPIAVSRQPYEGGERLAVDPIIYRGLVENCTPGDSDADSDELVDYTIEMTVESVA